VTSIRCLALLAALAVGAQPSAQRRPPDASSADLVELDVVVVDRNDRPVAGLGQKDFEIKDDGHVVEVKTFAAISSADPALERPRQMTLLLDDSSVPMGGTRIVQGMAKAIISRMRDDDDITVIRLNNERDEPFGDAETAVNRIVEYRAGAVPFQSRGTAERVLKVIAGAARQLAAFEHRRKLVVCIGGAGVCNVLEPYPRGSHPLWPAWVDMLAASARANVSIYAVMPVHPTSRILLGGGMVNATGGDGFKNTVEFERFVDGLWTDASDYYLLGYWPGASKRDLHSIEVKVARKDVHVRARTYR
jgi:hypothetical protein